MRTTRLASALLLGALAVGAAACSSSDEKPKTMSKAAFLEAADAICKKGSAEIDKSSDDVDQDDQAAIDAFVASASQKSLDQITAVRELGFPADDADELDVAFSAYERMFAALAKAPSKVSEGATPEAEKARTTLDAYGFEVCGV